MVLIPLSLCTTTEEDSDEDNAVVNGEDADYGSDDSHSFDQQMRKEQSDE